MSRMTKPLMAAVAVLLSAALFTCAGIAPASQTAASQTAASQTAAGPSFTGDGGRGMSLAVLIPEGRGIAADQNYLPTMVQGVLVSDLTKYSAISVLDRVRLETVLRETESGIYRNEADYGRLGQIANVDYALTGSITRTGSGYAMQIQVVGTGRNTIGVTKAAYSGTCTIAEFDNFTGIRKASLELLTQMGVALTASARSELSGAAQANFVNAQTSLAQGIAAQRGGNEFQAMTDYFRARTFSPDLSEASTRTASAMTTLAANNFNNTGARDRVLSEIQRRLEAARLEEERKRNIETLLRQATAFYKAHQPYNIVVIENTFYYGNINPQRRTVDIGVRSVVGSPVTAEFEIIRWLISQSFSINRQSNWPYNFRGIMPAIDGKKNIFPGIWNYTVNPRLTITHGWDVAVTIEPTFIVATEIVNSNGKVLKRVTFRLKDHTLHSDSYSSGSWDRLDAGIFFTINADDLTDNLTLRIVSVNGQNINSIKRNGSVNIPRESASLIGVEGDDILRKWRADKQERDLEKFDRLEFW